MPPTPIKFGPGGFTHLSQVIIAENPDGSMLVHTGGHQGNLLDGTQIQSLRMPGPFDGAMVRQLLVTLSLASSLALVALRSSDPTRWGLPSNHEFW
jgi:hypothetical protein